jgi:hypothetical protein
MRPASWIRHACNNNPLITLINPRSAKPTSFWKVDIGFQHHGIRANAERVARKQGAKGKALEGLRDA